jgi:CheY-like chemotaxis protein
MNNIGLHISDADNTAITFTRICDTPEALAKMVFETYPQITLFIINVNYKTENVLRSQNAGINLLKYLRLYNLRQHCVLYSFLSREQVMVQDPKNLIIFSEGVTFVRLPQDLSNLDFERLVKKTAPDDLSAYFKAESRLPDDRHFTANWWGVLQLWKVQKAVEKITSKDDIPDIENLIMGSLKEMNSYQGLMARYLKKTDTSDIEHHLKELSVQKKEKFINDNRLIKDVQGEIEFLSEQETEYEIQLSILKETLAESKTGFFRKLLSQISSYPEAIRKEIVEIQNYKSLVEGRVFDDQDYISLTKKIENEQNNIYALQREINQEINSKVTLLENKKKFSTDGFLLEEIRKDFERKEPEILYVDDQANDGWAAIFQRIIYGRESDSFSVLQPSEKDTIDDISQKIQELVSKKRAKLLILDLRLHGEKGSFTDVSKISGFMVLTKLVNAKMSCPILITTASNKIWSYKETYKSGASAYWIKEGLDERIDIETSVDNYLRLIDIVNLLCFSDEFMFLYEDFQHKITALANKDSVFWWESKFWGDKILTYPKTRVTSKDEILECLDQAYQLFQDYLMLKIQNLDTAKLNTNISSLIVMQCARILEIIHSIDDQRTGAVLSAKIQDQLGDDFFYHWSKMLSIRNGGAHYFNVNFNKLKTFVLLLFEYLNTEISNDFIVENEKFVLKEPINGEVYDSIILSKHRDYETYYLKNPELNLLFGINSILLDLRFNMHLGSKQLEIGTKIKFVLKIIENGKTVKYTATKSEILN